MEGRSERSPDVTKKPGCGGPGRRAGQGDDKQNPNNDKETPWTWEYKPWFSASRGVTRPVSACARSATTVVKTSLIEFL